MKHGFATKAFYFSFSAAMASLALSLVLYYGDLGFSGQQIGTLTALFPLMLLAGASLLSPLADVMRQQRVLLAVLHLGAIISVLSLAQGTTYLWLSLSLALFAFCCGPILPIIDSAVLTSLGEHKERYSHFRVWAVVGWGVTAPLAGALTERFGLHYAFWLSAGLWVICLALASLLPLNRTNTPTPDRRPFEAANFINAKWGTFLALACTAGVALTVCGNYVYLYLAALGASQTLIGFSMTSATLSEFAFTLLGSALLRRLSAPVLLLGALAVFGVRLLLYPLSDSVIWVLAVQLLHGASFGVFWVAGVAYADSLAPAHLKATAQGLFSATIMGGSASGGLLAGVLYGSVGASATFTLTGLSVCVVTGLLLILVKYYTTVRYEAREGGI